MARLLRAFLVAIACVGFAVARAQVALSPTPIQHFLDNNGNALSGGKLFVYNAGSTTKATTYTDSTGATAQTNPIILNTRGEPENGSASVGIWLTPGQNYKYVLSPSTDTDPPTNPIWTLDQIQPGGAGGSILMSGSGVSPSNTAAANTTAAQAAINTAHTAGVGILCDVVGQIPFTDLAIYSGDHYTAVPGCIWQMTADGVGWQTVDAIGNTFAKATVTNVEADNLQVNMNNHNGTAIMWETVRGNSTIYRPIITGAPANGTWSYVALVGTETLPNASIMLKGGYAINNVQENVVYKPVVNGATWTTSNTCSGVLSGVGIWLGTDPVPPAATVHNLATHNRIIQPNAMCQTVGIQIMAGNDNVIEQPEVTADATGIVLGQASGGTVARNKILQVYAENDTTAVVTANATADSSNLVTLASTQGSTAIETGAGNIVYDTQSTSGWRAPLVILGDGGLGISWQNPPGTSAGINAPFCSTTTENCHILDGAEGADLSSQVVTYGSQTSHFTGVSLGRTHASPAAVAQNQVLSSFDGAGSNSTSGSLNYITGGMQVVASEAYTASHEGSYLNWFTTPTGTKTSNVAMSLTNAGNLIVSQNAQVPNSAPAGVQGLYTAEGIDSSPATFSGVAAASPSYMTLQRADGTMVSPSAVQSGEVIGQFGVGGYGTSWTGLTGQKGFMRFTAAGNWSGTSNPTTMSIFTTAVSSTTPTLAMTVDSTQAVTMPGTLINSGIASAAQADVVCTTSAGTFSYQVWATGCAASAKALKNAVGSVNSFVALYRIVRHLPFGAPIWAYKESPALVQMGEYADDVCAMDERLCSRDKDGNVLNYDKNGLLAYLAAGLYAVVIILTMMFLFVVVVALDLYRRIRRMTP